MFLSVFTEVLQTNDAPFNDYVTVDLGEISSVCGVTTQGRGVGE